MIDELFEQFEGAFADSTIRSYRSDLSHFSDWCDLVGGVGVHSYQVSAGLAGGAVRAFLRDDVAWLDPVEYAGGGSSSTIAPSATLCAGSAVCGH